MSWFSASGHLLSVATYVMTVLFVSILLRSRRSPASMIAWLVVIAFVPYFGIPLFLMIGGRKMGVRREKSKAPLYSRRPYSATEPALGRIDRVLRSAGAPEPVSCESIQFLDSGEKSYVALLAQIRAAKHSIDLATFILKRDTTGSVLLGELALKAKQGVKVRLLLDALGSNWLVRPSLKAFRNAGGQVEFFMPLIHVPFRGRINLRNHRKLAVFDGGTAWFGGMNLANEYMGSVPRTDRWVDLSILVQGKPVEQLHAVFDCDWVYAGGKARDPEAPLGESENARHRVQAVASGPDTPTDSLYEVLLEACYEARSRIWIVTPYFIPDESLIKALELACKRGVDVKLLMPARSNHRFADLSRGGYVRQVLAAGGHVYLYPKMVHTKLVVVDESFALTGSANFDLRSLLYNYEIGVFLRSAPDLEEAASWIKVHVQLAREGYPPAGFWRDLSEGVGRIFGPLL